MDTSSSALLYLEDMFYSRIHCQLIRVLACYVHYLAFLPIPILNSVNKKEVRVNWCSVLNEVFVEKKLPEDNTKSIRWASYFQRRNESYVAKFIKWSFTESHAKEILFINMTYLGIFWWSSGWDFILSLPRVQAQSLVRELRSHKLCGTTKKIIIIKLIKK